MLKLAKIVIISQYTWMTFQYFTCPMQPQLDKNKTDYYLLYILCP